MDAQFDPSNIRQLFEQDDAMAATVAYTGPAISKAAIRRKSDEELADFLKALREAVKLPLSYRFVDGMRAVLTFSEAEAKKRVQNRRRMEKYGDEHWSKFDLLGAVKACAGPGRKVGKEWVFKCPFPDHEDRHPSFMVNPEAQVWWCSCSAGGVVDFKKRMGIQ